MDGKNDMGVFVKSQEKAGGESGQKAEERPAQEAAGEMPGRAARQDLWKYCTWAHYSQMILSFRLLGDNDWPDEKVLSCLYALSNHTEKHYEKIRIPKKGGGFRVLKAPDPLLKYVQKNLLHHVLEGLSLSDRAAAYHKKGDGGALCGTVENASAHRNKPLVLKLDIENFFGNITFPMVLHHVFSVRYFPPAVGNLLASLCCCGEYLPQGAPTSPAVSNLVMKPFDEHMEKWCRCREIVYSRYCDDLTFSGCFDPGETMKKTEGFLGVMGFELNRKKTRILSKASRQTVTGLVVNEKVQPSREYRRRLRQEIYYCRKFGVEEHIRHVREQKTFPNREEDSQNGSQRGSQCRRAPVLHSLLGKVNYVRLTCPEDVWFAEAEKWLREQLLQGADEDGKKDDEKKL